MQKAEYHELERRSAFWRNSDFDLEQVIKHFKKHIPDSWCDENDKYNIEGILCLLNDALRICKNKEQVVLLDQVAILGKNGKEWRSNNGEV